MDAFPGSICPDGGIGSEVHTESIEMLFVGFSRTQSRR